MGVKSQKEKKINRSGKKRTTAMGKQSIVQITVLKRYSCIIQGIYSNRNVSRPTAHFGHLWDNCHYKHRYLSSFHG